MPTDPNVREEARGRLSDLFSSIGRQAEGDAPDGMLADLGEFLSMPTDLALLFLEMSTELAELVLRTLEQAGYTLVKGMTPL